MRVLLAALFAIVSGQTAAPPKKLDLQKLDVYAKRFFAGRPSTRFEERDPTAFEKLLAESEKLGALAEGQSDEVTERLFKAARKTIPKFPRDEFDTPFGKASWIKKPATGKSKGLIVGLHGGGEGAGDASEAARFAIKDCVGVYPQGIRLVDDTWNTVHGERFVLTLIERAKLFDEIDPDRVYVAGFSMGGTGSWFFAGRYPFLFAAAAPGPGVFMAAPKSQLATKEEVQALQHGLLPNVRSLPISFYIGLEDKNTMPGTYLYAWDLLKGLREHDPGGYQKIQFRVFENLAHEFPAGEPESSLAWLASQTRDPYPAKLVWEYALAPFPEAAAGEKPGRLVQHRFYWLRCDEPRDRMRVTATRDGNKIDLNVAGAEPASFRVLLNAKMIDTKEDVALSVNGKEVYRGKPAPDLRVLLRSFDEFLDRRLVFDREIP